jgi:hypothetical protein
MITEPSHLDSTNLTGLESLGGRGAADCHSLRHVVISVVRWVVTRNAVVGWCGRVERLVTSTGEEGRGKPKGSWKIGKVKFGVRDWRITSGGTKLSRTRRRTPAM